ncbi:ATP-binding protein [Pelagovum pacificum]|uniref:histidine kinase n=1 Tax=Pelagovum pacificum TaxID=2588711 RepID=A0A5C5GBK1_9RHOB|nr:ATP-binding protein [Pelagovum pacificum]QQA44720.1 PAS domain S-box protein [Pelagovum pacificum]TNY32172.1 PAS domain S-box protein [Pelagovum pacificum]
MKLGTETLGRVRLLLSLALGTVALVAILFLSVNVARDLRLLNSASSDNVQWSLSQAEVEFLEFELQLEGPQDDVDLADLRQKYDIFYSRVTTLRQSSIYAELREEDAFARHLRIVETFLSRTVPLIDAADPALRDALPELSDRTEEVRPDVRMLANSGLNFFATASDVGRNRIAVTLTQLAAGTTFLILLLLFFAIYLARLNAQNSRRRAEAIEAGRRMNVVTSTALDAVIVSDTEGRVLDYNAAAEQIFGYTAEEAIGRNLGDLIVPDHHLDAHQAGMQRMRDGGERRVVGKGRVKLEAKRASGEVFPVEFAIQSAETDDGLILIAFLRDISHRVEAERELVAARDRALAGEKAKTDFLATMSHEIRTPLNGLLGNLSLMRDTELSPGQERYMRNMETSGKLLMSHISDVLDITKYDAGKLRLRPVEMNVSRLIQDIVDNQGGAAAAHRTTLDWRWIGPPVEWIRADRDRLQHVLMNIIGNAVKFTHDGRVIVEAEVEDPDSARPELQITVSDDGIGMSEDLRARIFDDFVTGDSSYDRDVGGTGLGLAIAQRFIKALGGLIEVESEPGTGSTFRIRFPVEPVADPTAEWSARKPERRARAAKILLVEDNEINRVVAREMLIAGGHTVEEAHDGQMAVDKAGRESFDLILMDISMPVLDGRGATRAIRTGDGPSARAPIVALTANAMAEEQEDFLTDGMNDILTKPLSRAALSRVLAEHVGQAMPDEDDHVSPVVANSYLDDLRETLGVEALTRLLARFTLEVERVIGELTVDPKPEADEIAQRAHRVAGSAATFGAVGLRELLIEIESVAREGDRELLNDKIALLPAMWELTRNALATERRASEREDVSG